MYLRIKPEELVHQANKLDTTYWGTTVNGSKGIQDTLPRRADKVIGADIFQALYDWEPKMRDDSPDDALTAWINSTVSTPAFKKLREDTVGSRDVAAGATVAMYRELMRAKESTLKTVATTKHSIDQMNSMMVDGPIADQARAAIGQVQKELAESIRNESKTNAGEIAVLKMGFNHVPDTAVVAVAIGKATESLQMATELAEFDNQGEGRGAGSDAHVLALINTQLMERVTANDSLRKIFQIAGRMKVVLQQAKSRQPRRAPTPVSLEYGNDISNLVGSELAVLGTPETEDVFYQKYLEKGLLVYDHKAKVNEGLGPFIFLLDVSGSMSGLRLETAKALFVSLAKMAVAKRRKIVLIPFATTAGQPNEIHSASMLTTVLTQRFSGVGGGTIFSKPLESAAEYIKQQTQYKQADILLVTDGQSTLAEPWIDEYLKTKEQLKFRLYGVNVDGDHWHTNQHRLFDATAYIDGQGSLTSLDWMRDLADRMVR